MKMGITEINVDEIGREFVANLTKSLGAYGINSPGEQLAYSDSRQFYVDIAIPVNAEAIAGAAMEMAEAIKTSGLHGCAPLDDAPGVESVTTLHGNLSVRTIAAWNPTYPLPGGGTGKMMLRCDVWMMP
jgi:hypothetical protein